LQSQFKKNGGILMKKNVVSLAISMVTAGSLLLTGCSSQSTSAGNKDSKTEKAPKTVELKLGYYASQLTAGPMGDLVNKFEAKHPNIKITTETAAYGPFFQKLDTEIAAGNAPDIWLSDGVLVPKYAENGATKDLTSFINKDLKKNDYYAIDNNKDANGKYWGVPEGIQDAVIYYNKDMFDKAGVKYPDGNWTWDDLLKTAEQLTVDAKGKKPTDSGFNSKNVKQYGLTWASHSEGWFPLLKSYGGGMLDASLKKSILNSPKDKSALQLFADGMKKGAIIDPAERSSFQSPHAVFPGKSAAMAIGLYTRQLAYNDAGVNYDIAPLPKGPAGRFTSVIANSWVVNSKADNAKTQAAEEFIKFWMQEDTQKAVGSMGEALPAMKSVLNSSAFLNNGKQPANKQVYVDSLENGVSLDVNGDWSEYTAKVVDNLNNAFNGQATVQDALKQADQQVQTVLDNYYKNK
jgi:multiple sugar transport system substrate-binding protein